MIWGWGIAQNPYLLPQQLTISSGASPETTLTGVLIVFGVAVVLVLPAIGLLFALVQKRMVEETAGPADALPVALPRERPRR